MKKKIAVLLCLCIAFSLAFTVSASYNINTDLDHYKYMNIYVEDGKKYARPDTPITRAELANVVFNLLNNSSKNVPVANPRGFSDLSAEHEFYKQINFLVYRGFLQGYPDGSFQPDGALTRAEFAEVILRSQKLVKNETTPKAPDIESHWAKGSINTIMARGFMKGYPDGEFKPNNTITRAEVAATMNRIYNRELDTEKIVQNTRFMDAVTKQIVTPYLFGQVFEDLPKEHWGYDDMMEACISHRIYWDEVGKREIWIRELVD